MEFLPQELHRSVGTYEELWLDTISFIYLDSRAQHNYNSIFNFRKLDWGTVFAFEVVLDHISGTTKSYDMVS